MKILTAGRIGALAALLALAFVAFAQQPPAADHNFIWVEPQTQSDIPVTVLPEVSPEEPPAMPESDKQDPRRVQYFI